MLYPSNVGLLRNNITEKKTVTKRDMDERVIHLRIE